MKPMSNLETMALSMIGWLAREPERLAGFMEETGYDEVALKAEIGSEALHLAVLEYLLADESLLLQYCAETGTPPEAPGEVWRRAQRMDW